MAVLTDHWWIGGPTRKSALCRPRSSSYSPGGFKRSMILTVAGVGASHQWIEISAGLLGPIFSVLSALLSPK